MVEGHTSWWWYGVEVLVEATMVMRWSRLVLMVAMVVIPVVIQVVAMVVQVVVLVVETVVVEVVVVVTVVAEAVSQPHPVAPYRTGLRSRAEHGQLLRQLRIVHRELYRVHATDARADDGV